MFDVSLLSSSAGPLAGVTGMSVSGLSNQVGLHLLLQRPPRRCGGGTSRSGKRKSW